MVVNSKRTLELSCCFGKSSTAPNQQFERINFVCTRVGGGNEICWIFVVLKCRGASSLYVPNSAKFKNLWPAAHMLEQNLHLSTLAGIMVDTKPWVKNWKLLVGNLPLRHFFVQMENGCLANN